MFYFEGWKGHVKSDSYIINYQCNTEGFDKDELLKQETELRRSMSPFGSDG